MNETYPYPISNPELVPSSKEDAKQAFNVLDEFRIAPQEADRETFLKGWFAMHFLELVGHPDDVSDWDERFKPFCENAWERQEAGEIEEDHIYCADAQQQGMRLKVDGNLNSYVVATIDGTKGYLSANFDPQVGNQPCLTGVSGKCYIYDSPTDAAKATRHLNLESFEVYAGKPDTDLECPAIKTIPMKELQDKEVILQREDGLYLYRDGVTWGDCTTRACKYLLYRDNVESQIQQVKDAYGATWKWLDYQKILDALD